MTDIMKQLTAPLKASEIELRVGSCSEKGFSLLIFKTARVDMHRLNKVCGMNWSNKHIVDEKGNVTCEISIYDEKLGVWHSRHDTGTESYTEKEKGSYSDAFKRAGFRWGIGLELYNAPFIWVSGNVKATKYKDKYGKEQTKYVPSLYTNNLEISRYDVIDDKPYLTIMNGKEVLFNNFRSTAVRDTETSAKNAGNATAEKPVDKKLSDVTEEHLVDELVKKAPTNKTTKDKAVKTAEKTGRKVAEEITLDDVKSRIEKAKNAGFTIDRVLEAFTMEYGALSDFQVDSFTGYYNGL